MGINSSLFTKAELTTVPEIEDDPVSLPPPMMASPIQPIKPTAITEETHEGTSEMEQLDTLDDIIEEEETTDEMMDTNKETVDVQHQTKQNRLGIDNDFNLTSSDKSSMPEVDSLEFSMKLPNFDAESNPWDLVPDQPAINLQQTTTTQTNQQKSSLEIISTKPNSEST